MKICIDPGHGGTDSGACGYSLKESDVVLNISKILKQMLEKINQTVYMTREKDIKLGETTREDLNARCYTANSLNADLFVSVHCNSAENKNAYGFEIYTSKNASSTSVKLANNIMNAFVENKSITRTNRGVKQADFKVLTGTKMPAVLVETAFISNIEDNKILEINQKEIAFAIFKGICKTMGINSDITKKSEVKTNQYSKNISILSKPRATKEQMKKWAKKQYQNDEFISLVDIYYNESIKRGIDPVISFAQFCHETGFMYKVKSAAGLDKNYHNPCGMKIQKGGGDYDKNAHMIFATWQDGITAHLDHLALYAGAVGYPKKDTLDPRHFDYLFGTAKTVQDLSTKWCPSASYADNIIKFMKEIENTKVDDKMQINDLKNEPRIIPIILNGKNPTVTSVNIDGSEYVKLRDLAKLGVFELGNQGKTPVITTK